MYAPKNIGIFGLGNIGRALVKDLSDHYHLSVFDHNEDITNALIKIDSDANSLYLNADFIIGATGNDVSNLNWVKKAGKDKILMSVSSGDKEFKGLLNISKKYIQEPVSSLLDNVVINTEDGYRLKILRGGTPINFDNNIHSVLPEYIQLTRALLLIGVIQAIENSRNVKLENFIVALGIDNIGKTASKTISKFFKGKWVAFENAYQNNFNFTNLDDFGQKMNDSLYDLNPVLFFEIRQIRPHIMVPF